MMEGCTIGDCESIGLKTFELKKLGQLAPLKLASSEHTWAVHFSTLSGFTRVS